MEKGIESVGHPCQEKASDGIKIIVCPLHSPSRHPPSPVKRSALLGSLYVPRPSVYSKIPPQIFLQAEEFTLRFEFKEAQPLPRELAGLLQSSVCTTHDRRDELHPLHLVPIHTCRDSPPIVPPSAGHPWTRPGERVIVRLGCCCWLESKCSKHQSTASL